MAVSEEQFQILRGEHKVIALLLVIYLTNADQSVVVIVSANYPKVVCIRPDIEAQLVVGPQVADADEDGPTSRQWFRRASSRRGLPPG